MQYFRQKAGVETKIRGAMVTPLDLIDADIAELDVMTQISPEAERLENRLGILQKVRQELTPKRHSENQVIFRDAYQVGECYLPITGKGTDYQEYAVGDNRRLRTRVLHPGAPEAKTGADLVYARRSSSQARNLENWRNPGYRA